MARNGHVIINNGKFLCLRCKGSYEQALPCEVSIWLAAAKAFIKLHSGCNDNEQPSNLR